MSQLDDRALSEPPVPAPAATRGFTLRPMHVAIPIAVVAIGALAFVLMRRPAAAESEPPRDVPSFDGQWIRFSAAYEKRAGIEFALVEMGSLSPVVNVTGTVDFDPERVAVIGARISGRTRQVLKFPGDSVKPQEPMAILESAELGHAQSGVLAAKAHADAASMNETRERQLAEAKVSANRDAELAKATALAAKADLTAAQQRVHALAGDVGGGEIGVLVVTSPIAGKVVESRLSRGQSVDASAMLFRVADLSCVWIELAVFERELSRIRADDVVEISPQTNAALVLQGKVARVGDIINLETRSGEVRVVVENKEGMLRPGQSVIARIQTQKAATPILTLPRDAVTTVDGKPTVFVSHDATSVEPRAVQTGGQDGARIEIVSGLKTGERVAVKGVFALKSEIFR